MRRRYILDATHRNALEIAERFAFESESYFLKKQCTTIKVVTLRQLGILNYVTWSKLLEIIAQHPNASLVSSIEALHEIYRISFEMDYFMQGENDYVLAVMEPLLDKEINIYFVYSYVKRHKGLDMITISRNYVEYGAEIPPIDFVGSIIFGPHTSIACAWID